MKKELIVKKFKIILFLIIIVVCGYFLKQSLYTFISEVKSEKNSSFFVKESPEIRGKFDILNQKKVSGNMIFKDYFQLATLYAKRKDWQRAIQYYLKSIQLNPDSVEAYNNLGNVYFNLNQVDKAILYYGKASKLDPDYLNAYTNLGLAYLKKGLIDKAISQWDYVLKKDPDNKEVISYRQWIYQ